MKDTAKDPDTLLLKVSHSALGRDLLLSLAVHAALILLTSFGLYVSWAKWGIHKPSTIKALAKKADAEVAKAAREAEKLAASGEKGAADSGKTEAAPKNETSQKTDASAGNAPSAVSAKDAPKPGATPLESQIDRSKPTFSLDSIDLD